MLAVRIITSEILIQWYLISIIFWFTRIIRIRFIKYEVRKAIAAPIIPREGIKQRLRTIFRIAVKKMIYIV